MKENHARVIEAEMRFIRSIFSILALCLVIAGVANATPTAGVNTPPTVYGTCMGYQPGIGGDFCLNNGAQSFWQQFTGDVKNIRGTPQCSPTNTTQCGKLTVQGLNGVPLVGSLGDNQFWCFNLASGNMVPCTGGGGGGGGPINTLPAQTGDYDAHGFRLTDVGVGTTIDDTLEFGLNHLNDLAPATGVYSMNGFKIVSLAPGTVTNDALAYGQTLAFLSSATITFLAANGVKTVTAAPYNCKGDGSTDDTACIQQAIFDSCGGTMAAPAGPPHPTVYLPYTGNKYFHNYPIHLSCGNIAVHGEDQGQTTPLSQTYYGPAMLADKYGDANLEYGASLVGVTGNSLNMKSFIDSTGSYLPLNYALNSALATMNGKAAFNIHFVVSLTSLTGSGGDQQPIFASSNTSNAIAAGSSRASFYTRLNSGGSQFQAGLNFSTTGAVTFDTWSPSTSTTYEIEINSDGAGNCQQFVNGVQNGATKACVGTLVMHPYEVVSLPSLDVRDWPDNSTNRNSAWGFVDAVKIEGVSVHTANYLPNTSTKPTADANTLLLINWDQPTTQTQDTQGVYIGNTGTLNGYFPIKANHGQQFETHLSYLELCGNTNQHASGLYVHDMPNSEWDHLFCSNNSYIGFDFDSTVYNSNVHDLTTLGGSLCVNFGTGFSEATGLINDLHCSQLNVATLHTCYLANSAAFAEVGSQCQDVNNPGDLIFPWQEITTHTTHIHPFVDAEGGTSTSMLASFGWVQQPYAPEVIIGAEGNTRNGAPFIQQSGGQPVQVNGLYYSTQPTTEIFNITSPPSGPDLIINSVLPANGNRVCTASTVPLACCTGSGTGTCPSPPLANNPAFVDSIDNTYDNGTQVPNLLNNGITLPYALAGFITLGNPGLACGVATTANNATATTAKPVCSQPGVVEVCMAGAGGIPTLAIGSTDGRTWNQVGTTLKDGGDNNSEAAVWWSIAPAAEGSTSITGATAGISMQCGVMVGVDPISPVIQFGTGVRGFTAGPTTVIAPTVVTGNANAYVLSFAELNNNGTRVITPTGQPTGAASFTYTQSQPIALLGQIWGTSGDPSAAVTYTYSGTGSTSGVAFSIVFTPASHFGVGPAQPINPSSFSVYGPFMGLGSFNLHVKNITNAASPYTVLPTDYFITCDATAGAVVINMPAATGGGRQLVGKKTDASGNACTFTRTGGDLIDGATTAVDASQYQSFSFSDIASGAWGIF